MPNHCSSDLRINGSREDIEAFLQAVKGEPDDEGDSSPIDANKIIPYPKQFADLDAIARKWEKENMCKPGRDWSQRPKDGYNSGGYDWCIQNWGTKWGLYDFSEPKFGKTFAVVSFQTAWSPPLPIIKRMSELFPRLKFTLRFYECGAGIKGVYKTKAGAILEEQTTNYHGNRGG